MAMSEKQKIIETIVPVAALKVLTSAAGRAIPQILSREGLVAIKNFPFRVGRESRVKIIDGRIERTERSKFNNIEPNNDIYLVDDGEKHNISREHFQIERDGDRYYLYDRGSERGTIVGDRKVGGDGNDGSLELYDGDIIIIGSKDSLYQFRFYELSDYEILRKEK